MIVDESQRLTLLARVVEEPKDVEALVGEQIDLRCVLELPNPESITIWLKNSRLIATEFVRGPPTQQNDQDSSSSNVSLAPYIIFKNILPQVNNSLLSKVEVTFRITSVNLSDEDKYSCQAESEGQPSSREARVTVIQPPKDLTVSEVLTEDGRRFVGQGSFSESNELPVLVVRQNSTLMLECRTDFAKPPAQVSFVSFCFCLCFLFLFLN